MRRPFLPPIFLLTIFVLGGLSLASSPVFAKKHKPNCDTVMTSPPAADAVGK